MASGTVEVPAEFFDRAAERWLEPEAIAEHTFTETCTAGKWTKCAGECVFHLEWAAIRARLAARSEWLSRHAAADGYAIPFMSLTLSPTLIPMTEGARK